MLFKKKTEKEEEGDPLRERLETDPSKGLAITLFLKSDSRKIVITPGKDPDGEDTLVIDDGSRRYSCWSLTVDSGGVRTPMRDMENKKVHTLEIRPEDIDGILIDSRGRMLKD